MCRIIYNRAADRWYSESGHPVQLTVSDVGYTVELGRDTIVEITVDQIDYQFDNHGEHNFTCISFWKGDVREYKFDIPRGHPAYKFFKKEMVRDGTTYLKALDTPDNWQSY